MDASEALGIPLHIAAMHGAVGEVERLLSSGSTDVDQRSAGGWTPLMVAVDGDHAGVVTILLDRGADASATIDEGFTVLHLCARNGNLAMTQMLMKAGADANAAASTGSTPLHAAAEYGHSDVMAALIEAGASVNYRTCEGDTPLYTSCGSGHLEAVRVLLRAKADPLATCTDPMGQIFNPLEIAVFGRHYGVVRELLKQLGAEGCGGTSGGVRALRVAAQEGDLSMLSILTGSGVIDTGTALCAAAGYSGEAPVKYLLQQHQRQRQRQRLDSSRGVAYVNAQDHAGKTPVISGILLCRPCSPRVVRMLIDAGAYTDSVVRLENPLGVEFFRGTPLTFLENYANDKRKAGASEETSNMLEAIRRLLLRVDAVHALSWLWHSSDTSAMSHAAASKAMTKKAPTTAKMPLIRMLLILRRRAKRRNVVLASLLK